MSVYQEYFLGVLQRGAVLPMKKYTYMYLYMYLHVYVYKTDAWIPIGKGKGKKGDIFWGKKIIKASNQEVYVDFLPARKSEFCPMRRRH